MVGVSAICGYCVICYGVSGTSVPCTSISGVQPDCVSYLTCRYLPWTPITLCIRPIAEKLQLALEHRGEEALKDFIVCSSGDSRLFLW
jgi:hypothetical protein